MYGSLMYAAEISERNFIFQILVIGQALVLAHFENSSTHVAIVGTLFDAAAKHSVSKAPGIAVQGSIMTTIIGLAPALVNSALGAI